MLGDRIPAKILSVRILPDAAPALLSRLGALPEERSLGLFTSDCDDVSYAALDEATKKAQVRVVYARSMYAGAGNASTRLAGEFIGVLAGPDPEQVRSGLDAAASYMENDAAFYSADRDDSVVISRIASPARENTFRPRRRCRRALPWHISSRRR